MARRPRQDERPIPAHPYRDTALVYGCMAVVILIVSAITGGDLARAGLAALGFWVVATGWTMWRFRVRIKARDARKAEEAAEAGQAGKGEAAPEQPHGSVNGNGRPKR